MQSLSTEGVSTGGNIFADHVSSGVFVSEATIVKVEDLSGTKIFGEGYDAPDLAIAFTLKIAGLSFEPVLKIFGNLNLGASEEKKRWGSAFKVAEALKQILGREAEVFPGAKPTERIPKAALKEMIGKKILYTRYYAGERIDDDGKTKANLKDYSRLAVQQEGEDLETARHRAAQMVIDEDARTEGQWPKDYDPEGFEERQKRFSRSQGEVVSTKTNEPSHRTPDEDLYTPNDDIPF